MQIIMTKGKPQQASQGIFSFRGDFRSRRIQNTIQMRRIDEVIKPYVDLKRKELKLQPTQKALLILDVFKGQRADKVLSQLASLNIEVVSLPANMTHFSSLLILGKALHERAVRHVVFSRNTKANESKRER